MGEIHEFILARVHEDNLVALASLERQAAEEAQHNPGLSGQAVVWAPRRALTEGEIKNGIVGIHDNGGCPQCVTSPEHGCETIRLLAEAWSSHPGYRSDWTSFHDGDLQISPSKATQILEELAGPECSPMARLTDHETEVLQLVAAGVDYRDIGIELFTSLNAVKNVARNFVTKSQFHRRGGDWSGPAGWPA